MDPIEQVINTAKLSAMTEDQKSRAEIAFFVYTSLKIQYAQNHVKKLQDIIRGLTLSEEQKNTLENTLGDDYAEIQHLMSSLNVECEAQLLEALKRKLG